MNNLQYQKHKNKPITNSRFCNISHQTVGKNKNQRKWRKTQIDKRTKNQNGDDLREENEDSQRNFLCSEIIVVLVRRKGRRGGKLEGIRWVYIGKKLRLFLILK